MKYLNYALFIGIVVAMLGCGNESNPTSSASLDNLFTLGASNTITDPDSIFGLWESTAINGYPKPGVTVIQRIHFSQDTVRLANECTFFDGEVLTAQAEAAVQVTSTELIILEDKKAETVGSNPNNLCPAQILSGSLPLTIPGGTVGSTSLVYTKISD